MTENAQPARRVLHVGGYFDGEHFHEAGPYRILVEAGRYRAVLGVGERLPESFATRETETVSAEFMCPALAEAHAHLFLDGDELAPDARAAHLKSPRSVWLETARRNLDRYRDAGITLVRDAGDAHGVNLEIPPPRGPPASR